MSTIKSLAQKNEQLIHNIQTLIGTQKKNILSIKKKQHAVTRVGFDVNGVLHNQVYYDNGQYYPIYKFSDLLLQNPSNYINPFIISLIKKHIDQGDEIFIVSHNPIVQTSLFLQFLILILGQNNASKIPIQNIYLAKGGKSKIISNLGITTFYDDSSKVLREINYNIYYKSNKTYPIRLFQVIPELNFICEFMSSPSVKKDTLSNVGGVLLVAYNTQNNTRKYLLQQRASDLTGGNKFNIPGGHIADSPYENGSKKCSRKKNCESPFMGCLREFGEEAFKDIMNETSPKKIKINQYNASNFLNGALRVMNYQRGQYNLVIIKYDESLTNGFRFYPTKKYAEEINLNHIYNIPNSPGSKWFSLQEIMLFKNKIFNPNTLIQLIPILKDF
tara:strand:+ start:1156 stop:2319 length:1164 start_codon:yes stop_codon:yes gene_type:complete